MSTGTLLAIITPIAVVIVVAVAAASMIMCRRKLRERSGPENEFVDRPEDAVHDADRLGTSLMQERGYPTEDTEDFEQQLRNLPVQHSRTFEHCRAAHDVDALSTRHEATTEQLRGAMVHHRALFAELLSGGGEPRCQAHA